MCSYALSPVLATSPTEIWQHDVQQQTERMAEAIAQCPKQPPQKGLWASYNCLNSLSLFVAASTTNICKIWQEVQIRLSVTELRNSHLYQI